MNTKKIGLRLSGKKLKFALEYLDDLDEHAAAERAGYKGTSKASKATIASRLKNDPAIIEYVYDRLAKRKLPIIEEFAKIAYAKADGKKLKSSDKVAALDKLARIAGIYQDSENASINVQPIVNISLGSDDEPMVTIEHDQIEDEE